MFKDSLKIVKMYLIMYNVSNVKVIIKYNSLNDNF